MYCQYCGAVLIGPFCSQCGKEIRTADPVTPKGPSVAGAEMPENPTPVLPVSSPEPKASAQAATGTEPASFARTSERGWNPAESMRQVEETAPPVFGTVPEEKSAKETPDDISFLFDFPTGGTPVSQNPSAMPKTPLQKQTKPDESRTEAQECEDAPKRGKRRREKRLSLGSAFPALLALFLPACYFFFDLFVVYGDALSQKDVSGVTALARFMNFATSAAYDTSSISEITTGVFGEGALFRFLSCASLAEESAYRLPILATLIAAGLSVLAGALILFTGARILRSRVFLDFMTFAGLSGTFAPLVGQCVYISCSYIQYSDFAISDRVQAEMTSTLESLLLMCLCLLFVFPSLRSLKKLGNRAAKRDLPVALPCAVLGARFLLAKIFTLLTAALCLVLAVAFLVGPIYSPELNLTEWSFSDILGKTGDALRTAISGNGEENLWMVALPLLTELVLALQVPLLAISLLPFLIHILRILFTGKKISSANLSTEKSRPSGKVTSRYARNLLLLPFATFAWIRVLIVVLIFFASHMAFHMDLSEPGTTLTAFYLVIAYVKRLGGPTSAYTILMLAGAPLWHLVGNFHNAMTSHRVEKAPKPK